MPELPEVETLVRTLQPALLGCSIHSVDLYWSRSLSVPSAPLFKKQIVGQEVKRVYRRGKFFVLQLTRDHLVIHLRMSGDLSLMPVKTDPGKHDRLHVNFYDGNVFVFSDPRKFGRLWLLQDPQSLFSTLGLEPLDNDFTPAWLSSALKRRRRQLKPLLLDQRFIAGLGNIYTDEALHKAGLHPQLSSSRVTDAEAGTLCLSIREILKEGILRNGSSIDWVYRGGDFQNHFSVYGRKGLPCPVCGTPVERMLVGQRGTHLCPTCQKIR